MTDEQRALAMTDEQRVRAADMLKLLCRDGPNDDINVLATVFGNFFLMASGRDPQADDVCARVDAMVADVKVTLRLILTPKGTAQ